MERGDGGEEVTDSQYDNGYGDSPNKIFLHIFVIVFSNYCGSGIMVIFLSLESMIRRVY